MKRTLIIPVAATALLGASILGIPSAQAQSLGCVGLPTVSAVSARGASGCIGTRGPWSEKSWTGSTKVRIRIVFSVKDTLLDGHCAYLHLQHAGDGWPGAVVKACGVGTAQTVTHVYTIRAYTTDAYRVRTHEGYGHWSAVRAITVTGAH